MLNEHQFWRVIHACLILEDLWVQKIHARFLYLYLFYPSVADGIGFSKFPLLCRRN